MEPTHERICSYVVKNDRGLAPNPFWGYCTLALCTPNRRGVRARKGDWIAGVTGVSTGHRLLYAMQLTEDPMQFDDYFRDPRFALKKPQVSGDAVQRCGDNMYYKQGDEWVQIESPFHRGELETDTKNPYVFISTRFFYFGRDAVELPEEFRGLLKTGSGCRWDESDRHDRFLKWLQESFDEGMHAKPHDS